MPDDNELSLVSAVKSGDDHARNQLVLDYLAFAQREAKRQAFRKQLDPEAVEGEAFFMILDAANSFDPSKSCRFATHLGHQIRGYVTKLKRIQERGSSEPVRRTRKDRPLTQWEQRVSRAAGPISQYWPPAAVEFAKRLRRRNDRMIAKWLWLDYPPKRQSEIARKLRISRSAVNQRRNVLMKSMTQKFGLMTYKQLLTAETLNKFESDAIY